MNIFYQELNYRTVDETPVYSVSWPGTKGLGWGRASGWPGLLGAASAGPWAPTHCPLMPQVPQLLSAMGSLWSLWFGSSVLSVLELLELLLDATALALLLGCRRLRRAWRSQPGAATRASGPRPEATPLPSDCGPDLKCSGTPAGASAEESRL